MTGKKKSEEPVLEDQHEEKATDPEEPVLEDQHDENTTDIEDEGQEPEEPAIEEKKPTPEPFITDIATLDLGTLFVFGRRFGRLVNRQNDTGELLHYAAELEPIEGHDNAFNQIGVMKLPSGSIVTVIS